MSKSGMTPLDRYRQAQRRARRLFAPFTAVHCPACAVPCCRKPTWVRPVDIVLIEELGFSLRTPNEGAPAAAAPLLQVALSRPPREEDAPRGEPCEYLGPTGCVVPSDLRLFGCAAFICSPMRQTLPPEELARVEAAVAELAAAHTVLMEAIHRG